MKFCNRKKSSFLLLKTSSDLGLSCPLHLLSSTHNEMANDDPETDLKWAEIKLEIKTTNVANG
jgi:hypothetical protein